MSSYTHKLLILIHSYAHVFVYYCTHILIYMHTFILSIHILMYAYTHVTRFLRIYGGRNSIFPSRLRSHWRQEQERPKREQEEKIRENVQDVGRDTGEKGTYIHALKKHIHKYIHTYVRAHTYIRTYTYVRAHTYIHTHIHTYNTYVLTYTWHTM